MQDKEIFAQIAGELGVRGQLAQRVEGAEIEVATEHEGRDDRSERPFVAVARVLAAWTVSSNAVRAASTALWGLLAAVMGARGAIALAGVLLLATPLLLPRGARRPVGDLAASAP